MAVITPESDLIFLKVPLEIDNKNQLTFANTTAQYNYFYGLTGKRTFDKFTYIRKDGVIKVPALIDDLYQYNYVMYRNENFSNKWFYAYITGYEFESPNCTAVSIKTDVWQTWFSMLNIKRSFVEREHVNDDTVGLHTVPEGLELGDYEIVDLRDSPLWDSGTGDKWRPCFVVTKLPSATTNLQSNGRIAYDLGYIGGVFSSLHIFATHTLAAAQHIIDIYNNDSSLTADAIVNIYMVPACCVNESNNTGNSAINSYVLYPLYNYKILDDNGDPFKLQQPQVLAENYTPVNKKLLTYPYSYFYVTNKAGQTIEYHYEDFPFETMNSNRARTISYRKAIVPSASLSAKLYFTTYKNYSESSAYGTKLYSYGIDYPKIPVCAWTTDYYTNWLTQNGVNVGTNLALGVAGAALGVATGGVGLVAGAVGLASTIGSAVGQVHRAETTPPSAHGDVNTGDFQFCFQRSSISFYEMSIRKEVAQIIDGWFSMFGYKVNTVKIPNVQGRTNWNFVKTIGCYIEANIPQEDLNEIKGMFDAGITFWHNPSTFGDYSQSNTIVS